MLVQTVYRLAAVAAMAAAPMAPEPPPVQLNAAALADGGPILLIYAWKYHAGDDPRWADPTFDDTGWEPVKPQMPVGEHPRAGWPGTGWFRRHLNVEPAVWGKPLVVRLETPGRTAVFLAGEPLLNAASPGAGRRAGAWREVVFSPRPAHVLAVRHTYSPASPPGANGDLGFLVSIETPDATVRGATTVVPAFLSGFLALLHLALYVSYPKARENLFYALTMVAFAAIMASDMAVTGAATELGKSLAHRLVTSSILAATFFCLLTFYAVRTRAFPRTWILFAAVGAALIAWVLFHARHPSLWIWSMYFASMLAEIIRVEATGGTVEREGSKILLGGFVALGVVIALQALIDFGLIPPLTGVGRVYQLGMLALAVAMSLFLAQGFARTRLALERRLDEVRTLSEQVLAQERAAHEQELRRRVLEVENARQTMEIEGARALQLSMLPAKLPEVAGLSTAAAVVTASEVGGDYYDFRIAPDGSLVVAFGDAAGHGVAAGIMVTAVKALFSTLGGGESLSGMVAECDRVLRDMQSKPLHMCLTFARVTPRAVTLCSAGMPPVLIHRAGSGTIEELGTGGRPIGSRLVGAWHEDSAPLAPGDALLFASDGFAEQLDPADQPLGYEALTDAFRAAANLPGGEVVERLLARVAAWRREREQGDDITLVVVHSTSHGKGAVREGRPRECPKNLE